MVDGFEMEDQWIDRKGREEERRGVGGKRSLETGNIREVE